MKIITAIFFFAVNLSGVAEISLKTQKWVQCLAFSSDGQHVVAGNDEGSLWVVDASTAKTVMQIKDVASVPTAVAWSHQGTLIAVGGWRGRVHVCEAKSGKVLARWSGHKENIGIFDRSSPREARNQEME